MKSAETNVKVEELLEATRVMKTLTLEDEDDSRRSLEDWLIDRLTTISSFFDDLYLLRSFGIISETNFLYRKLNKGDIGSKVWLVSLVLSVRRSLMQLYKMIRLKVKLRKESLEITSNYSPGFRRLMKEKFVAQNNKISASIRSLSFDLLQDMLYMTIVIIEVFKINLSKKLRRLLEFVSSAATITKLLASSYQVNA